MKSDSPKNSKDQKKYDELCRAFSLKSRGRFDESLEILFELEKTNYERTQITGLIGILLYNNKQNAEAAIPYLQESANLPQEGLRPDFSELVSVGLFHALYEIGETDEAFGEMRRYMSSGISDSLEYRRFLKDAIRSIDSAQEGDEE